MSNLRDSQLQPTRTIREEILELTTILADSTARLNRVVERLDEREEDSILWKTRCEDSERSHKDIVNSVNWLRVQNEELQRRLDLHEPEILNNALDARAKALKRLKHARKVIRDLLEERNDMHGSPRQGSVTQADIDEALFDNVDHNKEANASSSSSASESGSGETVRAKVDPKSSSSMETFATAPSLHRSSPSVPFGIAAEGPDSTIARTKSSPVISSAHAPSSSSESNLIRLPVRGSPKSTRSSPETLTIHFAKPPGTALVRLRFGWEELQQILGVEDDAWGSLRRSSADFKDLRMKFEIMRLPGSKHTLAFLYDPIFVENGKNSYAINWGRAETNEELERHIVGHKENDTIFHTFTYPTEKKVWYYIGAHEWTVVELRRDLWPDDRKGRTKMAKKLCKPMGGEEAEEAELSRLVDTGELRQFCVELTWVEDRKESVDFADNVLGRSGVVIEPQYERTSGLGD